MEAVVGSVTIDVIDDGEVTLKINPATEIEDTLAVGDFVKVKYNSGLVAKKIELKLDELTFEGTIASFSDTELVLEDGTTFVIDGTEIEGTLIIGTEVKVDARPVGGLLIADEIEVEGGRVRRKGMRAEMRGLRR